MSKSWREIVIEIERMRCGSVDQCRPGRTHPTRRSEREASPQATFGHRIDDGNSRNVIHPGDHTRGDIRERVFTAAVSKLAEVASTGRPLGQCAKWISLFPHVTGFLPRDRVHLSFPSGVVAGYCDRSWPKG